MRRWLREAGLTYQKQECLRPLRFLFGWELAASGLFCLYYARALWKDQIIMEGRLELLRFLFGWTWIVTGLCGLFCAYARGGTADDSNAYADKEYRDTAVALRSFSDRAMVRLIVAAAKGDVGEIDSAVQAGADVNAQGKYGITPLFWAIQAHSKDGFRRLLEKGADPNYIIGNHPLLMGDGESETEDDPLAMAPQSWCVLDLAAERQNSEWVDLLLRHGANPNVVNPLCSRPRDEVYAAGWTPLIRAADEGAIKSVDLLIGAGAVLDHQDNRGSTAAMIAADHGRYGFVLRLLTAGAHQRVRNNDGQDLVYLVIDNSTRGQGVDPKSERGRSLPRLLGVLEKRGANLAAARRAVADEGDRRKKKAIERERQLRKKTSGNYRGHMTKLTIGATADFRTSTATTTWTG